MRTIGTVCLTCRRKECASSGGTPYNSASTLSPMIRKPYRDVSGGFYQALTYGNCAPRSSRTTRVPAFIWSYPCSPFLRSAVSTQPVCSG